MTESTDLPRILCVDDEPNVLSGLKRTLYDDYDVEVATSGSMALSLMERHGPYAVVVSDMRMPNMNGAQLLGRVRTVAPDTVRMLLTGHAEVSAAIDAVNEGGIFRFLVKPVAPEQLGRALREGVRQHQLLRTERDLLERTLKQSIEVLTEVLAMASPDAFDRTRGLVDYARHVVETMGWVAFWHYEVAILLSQLGCITLPADTLQRSIAGHRLSSDERKMLSEHPQVGSQLIARIPRMESVARIIAAQHEPIADTNPIVERGSAVLRLVLDYDRALRSGANRRAALKALRMRGVHDEAMIEALATLPIDDEDRDVRNLTVAQLEVQMQLEVDVYAENGSRVVRAGTVLTPVLLQRLENFARGLGVKEPIRVRIRKPEV